MIGIHVFFDEHFLPRHLCKVLITPFTPVLVLVAALLCVLLRLSALRAKTITHARRPKELSNAFSQRRHAIFVAWKPSKDGIIVIVVVEYDRVGNSGHGAVPLAGTLARSTVPETAKNDGRASLAGDQSGFPALAFYALDAFRSFFMTHDFFDVPGRFHDPLFVGHGE